MAETIDLTEVAQSVKEYERIIRGQLTNEVIATYYDDMADIARMERDFSAASGYTNKAANLRSCHRIMHFNHYKATGVKDYQRTIYCHDRFCPICTKLKANTREKKFFRVLEALEPEYDFYHMVLTEPNVPGDTLERARKGLQSGLKPTLKDRMPAGFKQLTRYFTGNAPIAGLDFTKYGYAGAVRTVEITFTQEQMYHVHYHAIVAMRKGLKLRGHNINDFSSDKYTGRITPFSDFEILLQKLWYLIMNGERVTLKSINALKQGYSCWFKKILPKESHDVFKYIVKPDKDAMMTTEIFQDLSAALENVRGIETYGIFRKFKLESEEIDDSFDPLYDSIVEALNHIERPVECCEYPVTVRDNIIAKKCLYISRRSIRSFVQRMGYADDDEFAVRLAVPDKVVELFQTVMPGVLDRPVSTFSYLDGGRSVKPKKSELLPADLSIEDIF